MMKNKCWVVKIGSALLTNNGKGIDKQLIARWVEQIVDLQTQNIDIILVSSGSIVEGMKRLGWKKNQMTFISYRQPLQLVKWA